ncbi:hypothetical protein BjapCC829_18865 [Bradyrhizobium barranii]|uniref:Four helix bundle protein n=1 Tax=Bradyrhizobium barranii TaxID=2992140 RepID=A0ABY3QZG3_9BRAD|nr:hypothetical protein [Bradyrhizobium japonicum]UFW90481.1 hypothetical protein BjapCC829_18865 [Bradyrhizobium japonicum]
MKPNAASSDQFADDLLEGAAAIAEFLFGSRELRRKVYYLAETSKLPVFRLGSVLCARKSVLAGFIKGQEKQPIRLLHLRAQIVALTGTIRQLEQAGFDTAETRHLVAKRRAELKGMSRR